MGLTFSHCLPGTALRYTASWTKFTRFVRGWIRTHTLLTHHCTVLHSHGCTHALLPHTPGCPTHAGSRLHCRAILCTATHPAVSLHYIFTCRDPLEFYTCTCCTLVLGCWVLYLTFLYTLDGTPHHRLSAFTPHTGFGSARLPALTVFSHCPGIFSACGSLLGSSALCTGWDLLPVYTLICPARSHLPRHTHVRGHLGFTSPHWTPTLWDPLHHTHVHAPSVLPHHTYTSTWISHCIPSTGSPGPHCRCTAPPARSLDPLSCPGHTASLDRSLGFPSVSHDSLRLSSGWTVPGTGSCCTHRTHLHPTHYLLDTLFSTGSDSFSPRLRIHSHAPALHHHLFSLGLSGPARLRTLTWDGLVCLLQDSGFAPHTLPRYTDFRFTPPPPARTHLRTARTLPLSHHCTSGHLHHRHATLFFSRLHLRTTGYTTTRRTFPASACTTYRSSSLLHGYSAASSRTHAITAPLPAQVAGSLWIPASLHHRTACTHLQSSARFWTHGLDFCNSTHRWILHHTRWVCSGGPLCRAHHGC